MPTLEETLRGLSPGALRIFKQQLPETLKRLGGLERNTALERLSAIPELQDMFQTRALPLKQTRTQLQTQPQAEQPKQWWQVPLSWLRNIETGAGTLITAPFTPQVAGTENLPWWQRERAEYEAWQEPSFQTQPLFRFPWTSEEIRKKPWTIGVKGLVEQVPWFATAIATAGLSGIGWVGARTGVGAVSKIVSIGRQGLKPILAVERAVTTAPFKVAGAVAKPVIKPIAKFIASELPKIARFTAPATEEIEKQITKQDWQRRVAQLFGRQPILKSITEKVGGRAATVTEAVEDTTARALLIAPRVQEVLLAKGQVALANLRKISQNPIKLFGVDEATGMAKAVGVKIEGASRHIADIAEHPANYVLNATQKSYIEQLHNIEDWVLDGLKEAGIEVKQLKFDEFSHWVHREVVGKNIDEALTKVRATMGRRIGARASWEKTRFYETAAEGAKAGIIYEPSLERVADLYIQTAAKRISDQRIAEMVGQFGQTVLERMPQALVKSRQEIVSRRVALRQMRKIIDSVQTGRTYAPQVWRGIKQWFPDEYTKLRQAIKGKPIFKGATESLELQQMRDELTGLKEFLATDPLAQARFKIGGKNVDLTHFVSLRERSYPDYFTVKEAEALMPGHKFPDYPGGRIPRSVALDDLTKKFKISADEIGEKVMGLVGQKKRIKELEKLIASTQEPIAETVIAVDREALEGLRGFVLDTEDILKAEASQIRPQYQLAKARAGVPSLGTESTIWHPAFQGRIYPKDVAGEIQRYWDDMGWSPLNKLATVSGEMRTLVAAADFSAAFIQGSPAIGLYPKQWAQALAHSYKSWGNTVAHQDFLLKHLDSAMEMANYGGFIGGFEYMEAMPQLQRTAGLVSGLLTKRPEIGREIIKQTYGRFEASFGAFGDALRIYLWDALKGRAKNTGELTEIARHINRMTGVMSQNALGIGRSQRAFEQAFLFFAPRYTRAGFALVGDALKSGITGSETRKALGSMMAAGAAMYAGTCYALGQEPNFDPTTGRFMTIEIKDPVTGVTRHFGIGGVMTSLVRFGADVTASMIGAGQNEPLDFVKLNRFDNPFIRFLYSKTAPMTSFMEGLMFGHNYFGEPFENAGDYAKFMAEQISPIALQETFMEKGGWGPTAIMGEELGLRVFPRSDWENRNVLRDQLAQKTYGITWNEVGQRMGELYQRRLENDNPDLQELTTKAQETSSKMARGEGKIWNTWRKEGQAVEQSYRDTINLAVKEFEAVGDGISFREKVDEASAIRRAMYATRERDPQYADIVSYFNEPLEASVIAKMNPKDLARREYYQIMYSPDMYDQYGNYRFDEADARETYFLRKYGQATLDYIQEMMGTKWEEPTALKILREVRNILQPYWNVETQVWSQYPAQLKQIADQIATIERTDLRQAKRMLFQYPQIVWIRKQIALQRRRMKRSNPNVANALRTFYGY